MSEEEKKRTKRLVERKQSENRTERKKERRREEGGRKEHQKREKERPKGTKDEMKMKSHGNFSLSSVTNFCHVSPSNSSNVLHILVECVDEVCRRDAQPTRKTR